MNGGLGTYGSGIMVSLAPYVDKNENIIDPKNHEYAFAVSTTRGCGMMKPFAVFSYAKKEFYVDIEGDGKIDLKYDLQSIEEGEKMITEILPNCAELEKKNQE